MVVGSAGEAGCYICVRICVTHSQMLDSINDFSVL